MRKKDPATKVLLEFCTLEAKLHLSSSTKGTESDDVAVYAWAKY